MHNLVRIGKGIVIFLVMLAVVDVVWLVYTYTVSINALEDTLSSISLVVAEDNCLDAGTGDKSSPSPDSKYYSIEKLMVENATAWLCYNEVGFGNKTDYKNKENWNKDNNTDTGTAYNIDRGSRSTDHTDIQTDDLRDVAKAMDNIDETFALTLTTDTYSDGAMYSYVTCPQRGQAITITLKANINVHLLSFIPSWGNVSIPVERQVTVIGMKFYKGKEGS